MSRRTKKQGRDSSAAEKPAEIQQHQRGILGKRRSNRNIANGARPGIAIKPGDTFDKERNENKLSMEDINELQNLVPDELLDADADCGDPRVRQRMNEH